MIISQCRLTYWFVLDAHGFIGVHAASHIIAHDTFHDLIVRHDVTNSAVDIPSLANREAVKMNLKLRLDAHSESESRSIDLSPCVMTTEGPSCPGVDPTSD